MSSATTVAINKIPNLDDTRDRKTKKELESLKTQMGKQSDDFDKFKKEMATLNQSFERALLVPPVVPFVEEGASAEFTRDVSNTMVRVTIYQR